jgi:hypothetical protein
LRLLVVGFPFVLLNLVPAVPAQAESGMLEFLRSRQQRRFEQVPRQVLAFYYTWYGRPDRHGRWIHWGKVDPQRHEISESTHYPAQGAYDSHDPEIIDWHVDQAQKHGITGFIATWWGQGTLDDRAFELLIERVQNKNFQVSVYWETAPGRGQAQIDRAVDDLLYVLRRYGSQEAFLDVDGKPVIFVYGRVMNQVPLRSWPEIIRRTRQQYRNDFLLIADGYHDSYARVFDGIHTYNICGWVRDKTPTELRDLSAHHFAHAANLARQHGKISCLTVIPGYDDTKIRTPGLRASRLDGKTYRVLWQEAIHADPDWVLITSWNEWHEGSEIEPSWEHDDKYLRITGEYAAPFRDSPPSHAATAKHRSGPSPEVARELQDLYRNRPIGILPDYGGEVVFWLADAGLTLKELSWEDVLDPAILDAERLPLVIYAGGEHYVRSLNEPNDVVQALQRYLRQGGFLLAVPFQPYPFFYDETGNSRNVAREVGLPIAGSAPRRDSAPARPNLRSWETPPADLSLEFHVNTRQLTGLPAVAAFPPDGDLRWRPATEAILESSDTYVSLATLKDSDGSDYGDGIAYVEHRSAKLAPGKTLYVWMRMPEVLGRDATFAALFRFASQRSAGGDRRQD